MVNLSLRPNSRQIPSSEEYTADKRYNDLMYGYLQSISLPGRDGVRYVPSNLCSYVKLAEALKISRPTAKKYFIELQELLLVGEKVKNKHELTFIGEEFAFLIPNEILIKLVESGMNHIISVYTFFCILSYNRNVIEYAVNGVKSFIGVATNTYSNSYIVINALDKLQELGLLEHIEVRSQENGEWKVQKLVRNVTNII